jgi:hypothetical protein
MDSPTGNRLFIRAQGWPMSGLIRIDWSRGGMTMRRVFIVIVLSLLLASSATALQKANRGQCRRIAKQLGHHAQSVYQAQSRGNALWARANLEQMDRLDRRRARLCPDLYPQSARARALAEMKRLAQMAAKAAVSFFTLGAK